MQTYLNCSRPRNLGERSTIGSLQHSLNSPIHRWKVPWKVCLCPFNIKIDLGRKTVFWLTEDSGYLRPSTSSSAYICSCMAPFVTHFHSSFCPCHYCCWWFYFETRAQVSWSLTPCVVEDNLESVILLSTSRVLRMQAYHTGHHRNNSFF